MLVSPHFYITKVFLREGGGGEGGGEEAHLK